MNTQLQQEREVNGGTPFAEARGSVNIPWYCPTCEVAGELTLRPETTIGQILQAIQCLHSPVCSGVAGIGYIPSSPNKKLTDPRRAERLSGKETMEEPAKIERDERGADSGAAHCSAFVYSGPHYGRKHRIIRRQGALVWVEYQGDKFAVPYCDVEECHA